MVYIGDKNPADVTSFSGHEIGGNVTSPVAQPSEKEFRVSGPTGFFGHRICAISNSETSCDQLTIMHTHPYVNPT